MPRQCAQLLRSVCAAIPADAVPVTAEDGRVIGHMRPSDDPFKVAPPKECEHDASSARRAVAKQKSDTVTNLVARVNRVKKVVAATTNMAANFSGYDSARSHDELTARRDHTSDADSAYCVLSEGGVKDDPFKVAPQKQHAHDDSSSRRAMAKRNWDTVTNLVARVNRVKSLRKKVDVKKVVAATKNKAAKFSGYHEDVCGSNLLKSQLQRLDSAHVPQWMRTEYDDTDSDSSEHHTSLHSNARSLDQLTATHDHTTDADSTDCDLSEGGFPLASTPTGSRTSALKEDDMSEAARRRVSYLFVVDQSSEQGYCTVKYISRRAGKSVWVWDEVRMLLAHRPFRRYIFVI